MFNILCNPFLNQSNDSMIWRQLEDEIKQWKRLDINEHAGAVISYSTVKEAPTPKCQLEIVCKGNVTFYVTIWNVTLYVTLSMTNCYGVIRP